MKSPDRTACDRLHRVSQFAGALVALSLAMSGAASAQDVKIVKSDIQIDALDPGIKLFMREKMAEGNTRFTDDNVILFLHGATAPSTCDFDLSYQDYSWADWMVKRGYVVYMGDYRNYGYSTREKAMDEPAAKNQPVTAPTSRCATSKPWSITSRRNAA